MSSLDESMPEQSDVNSTTDDFYNSEEVIENPSVEDIDTPSSPRQRMIHEHDSQQFSDKGYSTHWSRKNSMSGRKVHFVSRSLNRTKGVGPKGKVITVATDPTSNHVRIQRFI